MIAEGLQIVGDQLKENNPQVKKYIIEPIKERLKGEWLASAPVRKPLR